MKGETELADYKATIRDLHDKLIKVNADNAALERHFAQLNGEKDAIKAIQILCRAGRADYEGREKAEAELAALKAEKTEILNLGADIERERDALRAQLGEAQNEIEKLKFKIEGYQQAEAKG